jgi:hypothetical protein
MEIWKNIQHQKNNFLKMYYQIQNKLRFEYSLQMIFKEEDGLKKFLSIKKLIMLVLLLLY